MSLLHVRGLLFFCRRQRHILLGLGLDGPKMVQSPWSKLIPRFARKIASSKIYINSISPSYDMKGGRLAPPPFSGERKSNSMNRQHIGSDFDDFLAEEGLLAEAEAVAMKRVIAFQIQKLMEQQNISKSTMAKRMNTSRSTLNRLLDPENASVTLFTLIRAAKGLNKQLHFELV